jgi:CheY-like chemotaxis protein
MILLDYYMPGMNGKEFIQRLKEESLSLDTPILLITTDRLSQKELTEVGATYYMTKPFNFATFSSDIYEFLKKS